MIRAFSQSAELHSEGFHFVPIGIFNFCIRVCRSFGHPHDKLNHDPVKKRIFFIVEFSCKYFNHIRIPINGFEEFYHVRVCVRCTFFRFSSHQIYRKESSSYRIELIFMGVYKFSYVFIVNAISNACTDDYPVILLYIFVELIN